VIDTTPPLSITTPAGLTAGTLGTFYSVTFQASGGHTPYTWTLTSGSLPAGLTLTNGVLSGTPTTAGTLSFGLTVTDSATPTPATASRTFTITINPATSSPVITTESPLPRGTFGLPYSHTLQAIGGVPPYTWTLTEGSLHDGLTLSTQGVISGTPVLAAAARAARARAANTRASTTLTFSAQVADTVGQTAVTALALTIDPTAPTTGRLFGWCQDGGFQVSVPGASAPSTNRFQRSFPNCTVTVYQAGTQSLATIFSDAASTAQANPFTANSAGRWFFYAANNAAYDIRMSGGGIPAPFTLGDVLVPGNGIPGPPGPPGTISSIRLAAQFPGVDCGDQINHAYADLPPRGGEIWVESSCSFSTPINFQVVNKGVVLKGYGNATTLTYTGGPGTTAMALDTGPDFDFASTIRDLTLQGPGDSSVTDGLRLGGSNGCVGCSVEHVRIQGFGTGLTTGSTTWTTRVSQSIIRDNGVNLLLPSGMTNAGENLYFDHVTFADAPAPHTNSVWVQGGGQEAVFESCSFDQAQLRIGNGSTSAAQVVVSNSHFENPNFAMAGSVDYPFVVVDNNNGNYLRFTDNYILQARLTGGAYQTFMALNGGVVNIIGMGMFTSAGVPLNQMATLANNVNVNVFAFNDLSGNTGALFGGTTTGYTNSFPGVDTAQHLGFNAVLKAGDPIGGDPFDVSGNIRTSQQFVSVAPTGTEPLIVNSTTPVTNLFANYRLYDAAGNQIPFTTHVVQGQGNIPLTVTLSGAAAFSSNSSYSCTAQNTNSANGAFVGYTSGTVFQVSGTSGDHVTWTCIGY